MNSSSFCAIIVGGSYAGLSAAMGLGRSIKKVLIIDSGLRCNRFASHSHNFIGHDGENPGEIAEKAMSQVLKYDTVQLFKGKAVSARKQGDEFEITVESGEKFLGKKLLLATGVRDIMLPIPGFAECWGISILHCPFCHGYEIRNKNLAVLITGNAKMGAEFSKMIYNLSKDMTIFTNGPSTIPADITEKIVKKGIIICQKEIAELEQENGQLKSVVLKDGSKFAVDAIFTKPPFEQTSTIPKDLGLEITELGLIKVDSFQKTSVPGVFGAGDNTTMLRAVSVAVAAGATAAVFMVQELSANIYD